MRDRIRLWSGLYQDIYRIFYRRGYKAGCGAYEAHMTAGKKVKAAGGIADFNDAKGVCPPSAPDRLGTSRLVEQAKKKGGDLDAEI